MIYYPQKYGLCTGSRLALKTTLDSSEKRKTVVYKEILHNDEIIKKLNDKGIKTIDSLEICDNETVIIRAHGEPKETFAYLDENNINYLDATCPNVKKVHQIVNEKSNQGYLIVIVGKKNHPEVIGTCGWCKESIVIEHIDDIKDIPVKRLFVVAQTTISNELFENVLLILKELNYKFEYQNTICNAQKSIQDSSSSLAKYMDLMLVIGGEHSSNTKELFNICSKYCNSYFISNENDLDDLLKKEPIDKTTKIGITAGASTPDEQIQKYVKIINERI